MEEERVSPNTKTIQWPYWVGSGVLAALLVATLILYGITISALQDLRADLKQRAASEAASLDHALASDSEPPPSGLTVINGTDRIVATIESLRDDVALVRDALDDVQTDLRSAPMAQGQYSGPLATAPDIDPASLPEFPRPRPTNYSRIAPGEVGGVSDEVQEYVEAVFRDHSARAKERIAAQSSDPTRPDLEVMSRVMKESQREIAAELRDVLPQEEFEALFPPELGLGMPAAGQ